MNCQWGVGQRGEEIIRTLQSLVGRSANFIVAQQKSCDPNPKLTPPPPGDIMICPLARKPRSSNDTTAYMFIYWLVHFCFCYRSGYWTGSFWRWHSAVSQSGRIKFEWPGKGKEKCSTVEKIYLDGKDCSLSNLGYTQWDVSCFKFSRVTIIRERKKGLFATHCTREVTFMLFIKILSMEVQFAIRWFQFAGFAYR